MPRDTFENDIRRADRDLRSRQFARAVQWPDAGGEAWA